MKKMLPWGDAEGWEEEEEEDGWAKNDTLPGLLKPNEGMGPNAVVAVVAPAAAAAGAPEPSAAPSKGASS